MRERGCWAIVEFFPVIEPGNDRVPKSNLTVGRNVHHVFRQGLHQRVQIQIRATERRPKIVILTDF